MCSSSGEGWYSGGKSSPSNPDKTEHLIITIKTILKFRVMTVFRRSWHVFLSPWKMHIRKQKQQNEWVHFKNCIPTDQLLLETSSGFKKKTKTAEIDSYRQPQLKRLPWWHNPLWAPEIWRLPFQLPVGKHCCRRTPSFWLRSGIPKSSKKSKKSLVFELNGLKLTWIGVSFQRVLLNTK